MVNVNNIQAVFSNFEISEPFRDGRPFGNGHINDTYGVRCQGCGDGVTYIIQRINHRVFTNPAKLMDNIVKVTNYIRSQLLNEGCADVDRCVVRVVLAKDGASFHKDALGNFWRAHPFIKKATSCEAIENDGQAFQVARAFGEFQRRLIDFPPSALYETIPDFHSGRTRFVAFSEALTRDSLNRARTAKGEIDFVLDHGDVFDIIPKLIEEGKIPVRITHNDTKINNVMFDDDTGEAVCVIDLDTVMPGTILYDFGDILRTATSLAAEDERDLSKVSMTMSRFEAVLKGYLSSARGFLNSYELSHLAFSGMLITQIIGMRFLTDYLLGDHYFKIHREGHNLDRARAQFKLVQSIMRQESEMNDRVKEAACATS